MSVQFWGQLVCCIPEDACDSTCSLQSRAKNIACIGISSQHLKRVNSTEVQRLWLYHQSPQLNNNLKTPTVLPTTICLCSIQCFRIWNLVLRTRGQQHSMGDKKKELFSQMRGEPSFAGQPFLKPS